MGADIQSSFPALDNVSIPSRGSGKGDKVSLGITKAIPMIVSIPSRGSGKGDVGKTMLKSIPKYLKFQSPLGEVVKETCSC